MMGTSHIVIGVASWGLVCGVTPIDFTGPGAALAALGSLLPDIDHPNSTISNWGPRGVKPFKLIAYPVAAIFGHRGITHSLVAVIACASALTWFVLSRGMGAESAVIVSAIVTGYLSHVFADFATHSGVPWLWPKQKNYSLHICQTGSLTEFCITAAFAASVWGGWEILTTYGERL